MPLISASPDELTAQLEAEPWAVWLAAVLPDVCTAPFAEHHEAFWEWLWAIEPGERPDPFVGIWARGGAKSSSAEAACVALGARRKRSYGLYVSGTQEQADDHVNNVAALLETPHVDIWYPAMASRLVGKFGNSKGWRRNRIRTASGFTIDGLGLDTAARGVKLENQRPDFMIIDDVDAHDDSPKVVTNKITALTKKLLPAGSADLGVLAIQNVVHRDSIFARLADGRADFLNRRVVSGPIPAVRKLVTRHEAGRDIVVSGEPTWAGQQLAAVQNQVDDWGLRSFLAEAQHDVASRDGALWVAEQLQSCRRELADDHRLVRTVVGVDPSGGDGPDNDAQGIVVGGRDAFGHAWVLEDATCTLPPRGWGDEVVRAHADWDADAVIAEVNYGGAMVVEILTSAWERVHGALRRSERKRTENGETYELSYGDGFVGTVIVVSASRGKRVRAEPIAALYGRPDEPDTWSTGRVHHAGVFAELEGEMTAWRSGASWSPNRIDASVWMLTDLMIDPEVRGRRRSIVRST